MSAESQLAAASGVIAAAMEQGRRTPGELAQAELAAGILFGPEEAAELAEAGREQGRAETRAEHAEHLKALTDLLAAVRDGLDLPHAAVADIETRNALLDRRASDVLVVVESVLKGAAAGRAAEHLREWIDQRPITYEPYKAEPTVEPRATEGAVAQLAAAVQPACWHGVADRCEGCRGCPCDVCTTCKVCACYCGCAAAAGDPTPEQLAEGGER